MEKLVKKEKVEKVLESVNAVEKETVGLIVLFDRCRIVVGRLHR